MKDKKFEKKIKNLMVGQLETKGRNAERKTLMNISAIYIK